MTMKAERRVCLPLPQGVGKWLGAARDLPLRHPNLELDLETSKRGDSDAHNVVLLETNRRIRRKKKT